MRLSGDADTPGALFGDVELTSSILFVTAFGTYELLAGQAWGWMRWRAHGLVFA